MTERKSLRGPHFCNHFWSLLSFVAVVLMRTQEMFIFPGKETPTNYWYFGGLVVVRCWCWITGWVLLPSSKLLWQPRLMDGHLVVICSSCVLMALPSAHHRAMQAAAVPKGGTPISISSPWCPWATQSSPGELYPAASVTLSLPSMCTSLLLVFFQWMDIMLYDIQGNILPIG